MKKMIAVYSSIVILTAVANAQTWIEFDGLLDTNGNELTLGGGNQVFNLSGGLTLTLNWQSTGPNPAVSSDNSQTWSGEDPALGLLTYVTTELLTFGDSSTITGSVSSTALLSFGSRNETIFETMTATSDLGLTVTDVSSQTPNSTERHFWQGQGNTFTLLQEFDVVQPSNNTQTDGWRIAVDVVPEPSSTFLFGIGAFGLIARRKRL